MTFTLSPDFMIMLAVNLCLIAVAWGTIREQVRQLQVKSQDHDDMRDAVTELKTEMKLLREVLSNQPSVIGGVVSETIRATLQFVRSPSAKSANAA